MRKMSKVTVSVFLLLGACAASEALAADTDPRVAYNQGVDLYGQGDYNKAAESFQQALNTDQRRIEAWTNYNLGNARFEQAQAAAAQQPSTGMAALKEALLFFRRALEIDPQDNNAKYNYELTQQRLKQLEQQAQQQQDKQQEQPQESSPEQQENKPRDASAAETRDAAGEEKDKAAPRQAEEPAENRQEQQNAAAQGSEEEQQKMTPQEAQMLLDNFQRQEKMSQQMLIPERRHDEAPAGKDW